jgi:beta-lactam-binding protein with PASTA domain
MTIKEFFSFKGNRYFWVNIIGMVVAVFLLIFIVIEGLSLYTHHGDVVEVPDVKGLSLDEARLMLKNHGLDGVVVDSSYVKTMPAGCVLELLPAAGQTVKEGRVIYLTVNTGTAPLYVIPDVADNSSARQARARMIAAGFKLTEDEHISGERDWVYGVKYNGRELRHGEKVPVGATLTLLVGNGGSLPVESDSLDVDDSDEPVSHSSSSSSSSTTDDSWF